MKKNWLYVVILAYILLPIDLIPDVIPIIGTADDSAMLLAGIVKQYVDFRREEKGRGQA